MLGRLRPGVIGLWGRADGFEPSADVYLGVRLAAKMPSSGSICRRRTPLENREFRVAALDHIPVQRIARYRSADLTPEFLDRRHGFLHIKNGL